MGCATCNWMGYFLKFENQFKILFYQTKLNKFFCSFWFGFYLLCAVALANSLTFPLLSSPIALANLEYSNPHLKSLRSDVKENLRASRSRSNEDHLTKLEFYTYIVRKKDNFFTIMARTGMNLDSLSSVNQLASPHDIYPGQKILIPNMRGIYSPKEDQKNTHENRNAIAHDHNILPEKLIFDESRTQWFIPGGELRGKEKMFFYGFAFARPLLEGRMSSGFGKRNDPFTSKQTFHGGVDLAAPLGTSVFASADGKVEFQGNLGGYGKCIILKHELGYESRYGHLNKILVKDSSFVKKGEKIGEVGSTGRSTGNHLHFEVRRFSKREKPVFRDHR
jgi:murein DD-endopeptidase MepM/ murein hydrolase activator NlpD